MDRGSRRFLSVAELDARDRANRIRATIVVVPLLVLFLIGVTYLQRLPFWDWAISFVVLAGSLVYVALSTAGGLVPRPLSVSVTPAGLELRYGPNRLERLDIARWPDSVKILDFDPRLYDEERASLVKLEKLRPLPHSFWIDPDTAEMLRTLSRNGGLTESRKDKRLFGLPFARRYAVETRFLRSRNST
jgi:hypothetical protein